MTECSNLATKQELQELSERFIPKAQEASIVAQAVGISGQALTAGLAVQGGRIARALERANSAASTVATVGTRVNALANTTGAANAAALRASQAASRANFNALFAQSRAASAARAASSAASTAGRALSSVGSIFGIIGTLATAAALAALTQQVANLAQRVRDNREIADQNRRTIQANKEAFERNIERIERAIQTTRDDLNATRRTMGQLSFKILDNKEAIQANEERIAAIEAQNQQVIDRVNQVNQRIDTVNNRVSQVENNQVVNNNDAINQANRNVQTLRENLTATNQQIEFLTGTGNELRRQLEDLQIVQTQQRIEQLTNNGQQQEVRIRNLNDKVTNFDLEIQSLGKKGIELESSIGTANQNINSQVNQLRSEIPFTVRDTVNNPETIRNISTQVNNNQNNVNQEQVDGINARLDQLNRNVPGLITPTNISLAVGASSIVQQLLQNSGRISPCQAPALVPPVGQQARANNATILGFQALNTGQNVAIQNTVNVVNSTTTAIGNTLNNAQYGLQKIQNFASTAWQATRADKLVQVLNTALIINNGFYLSKNILSTLGDAVSVGLEAIGIKDNEGNALDVNSFISGTITSWVSSAIGTSNFEAIASKMKESNRIYQSAANLYGGVRSMVATAEEIAEETGIDVARIGNALRDSGTVDYDAYDHMAENPRWQGRIFEALEKGEDIADSLENIASETLDLTEQVSQFKEDKKEFEELITKEKQEIARAEEVGDRRIESLPETTEEDKLESPEDN